MARNSVQLTEAIAALEAKRSQPRSQASRDELRDKLNYLRGELTLQRAKEQWEAEQASSLTCHHCGTVLATSRSACRRCGEYPELTV
jgi:ribosomal protein L40E